MTALKSVGFRRGLGKRDMQVAGTIHQAAFQVGPTEVEADCIVKFSG